MTLYLINGEVVGGPCIDLSGLSRLSKMRHPQRSREALTVFDQVESALTRSGSRYQGEEHDYRHQYQPHRLFHHPHQR